MCALSQSQGGDSHVAAVQCVWLTESYTNARHNLQAAALIEAHGLDDTTYIYDLGNTTRLFKAWRGALPRVMPFYAVKCNPEVGCCCVFTTKMVAAHASCPAVIFVHPAAAD